MDTAVRVYPALMSFLQQAQDEASDFGKSQQQLAELIGEIGHGR
ncbi:hypothetical protein JCM19233_5353 [Vibrio astriarenae]|nr:hypothetical protein JCM19233_5353 [Vibrio sp. C7]